MQKILIVDDDDDILELIEDILNEYYDVRSASDGKKGLEIFKSFDPDLLLTDLKLPRKDGLTLLREVRELKKGIPVIVISGAVKEKKLLLDYGASAVIFKPFNQFDLLSECEKFIGKS